jgi:predicted AAA+ superfamily ATPase
VEISEKNANGNAVRKQTEVDFVINMADKRYYIQSALKLDTREKTIQEERPLMNIRDNFQKIILVGSAQTPWHTEEGILVMGVLEFLSNPYAVEMSL